MKNQWVDFDNDPELAHFLDDFLQHCRNSGYAAHVEKIIQTRNIQISKLELLRRREEREQDQKKTISQIVYPPDSSIFLGFYFYFYFYFIFIFILSPFYFYFF